LKFPLRTNDPVCDPPDVKQGVEVVKLRFVPVTTVPLFCIRDVVNARLGEPSVFVSVAVQLPVTVAELLELPPPHAIMVKTSARTIAIPNCFITTPYKVLETPGAAKSRDNGRKNRLANPRNFW
jgi:hypothetical protein